METKKTKLILWNPYFLGQKLFCYKNVAPQFSSSFVPKFLLPKQKKMPPFFYKITKKRSIFVENGTQRAITHTSKSNGIYFIKKKLSVIRHPSSVRLSVRDQINTVESLFLERKIFCLKNVAPQFLKKNQKLFVRKRWQLGFFLALRLTKVGGPTSIF